MYLPVLLLLAATVHADHYHSERLLRNKNAINTEERTVEFWRNEAKAGIEERLRRGHNTNKARNVIMFLGDGMSIPTLAAARTLMGQRLNRTGEESQMFFESFPTVGLSKTYCVNAQIPDSACTATAYLNGVKTNYGTIGVTADVERNDCAASTDTSTHLNSIAAWALADGRDAGVVTTTRITHASPAGTYARIANRNWESDADVRGNGVDPNICPDIAYQLVHTSPGNQFKVILGGGRREFLPNTTIDEEGYQGRRLDGRNLIDDWHADKESKNVDHQYVWNRSQLMSMMTSPPEYLLGLFEGSHMQYHMQADKSTEPTLAELTEIAIKSLSRNENGFFLFVESGRIDHAHHDNFVEMSLDETLQMDRAVTRAIELLGNEDTLIVVTADHAHVMTINGYTQRGGDILGPSDDIGDDKVPYMTLSYANGPGARTPVNNIREDVTKEEQYRDLEWRTHAEVPLGSETHGGDDVGVFANGPYNHMFSGLYEQSLIPMLMAYAACIGPGLHACSDNNITNNSATLHNPLTLTLILTFICFLRLLHR